MSSKRFTIVVGAVLIAAISYIAFTDAVRIRQDLQDHKNQIQELNTEYEKLNEELDKTIETKQKSQEEVKKLEEEKQRLEKERKQLEAELQAKIERKEAERIAQAQKQKLAQASARVINAATFTETASAAPTQVAVASGARSGCGDNQYAAYIYGRESGGRVTGNCDTTATNAGGCYGIGQACPGSKLPCGADYACQNSWFTKYAMDVYGSWAAAYNFHKNNGWW